MRIGFVGLGRMGAAMAARLAAAGHAVAGFDPAAPAPEGVTPAPGIAAAAEDAEIVVTMLPDAEALHAVASELLAAMRPGSVWLDCSTVDVETARALADEAAAAGVRAVDAPASGGAEGAAAGTLTFMAGGDDDAIAAAGPALAAMGARVVACGPAGAGQAAKLCNNMILGATMIATCEAFVLAGRLGLDPERFFAVASTSSANSWALSSHCPVPGIGPHSPADDNYRPGFAAEQMLRDLRLAQLSAETADADTPMGRLAMQLYERFVEDEGGAGLDFSAMLPRFEERTRD